MKPHFSEFTYGYCLIEELSRKYIFSCAPTFPSLIEEGRSGGYDVKVTAQNVPFFLQFKRSDYLSRRNAKYYTYFNSDYFRFDLHALNKSRQHTMLHDLETSGETVFYVAPKFHKNTELNFNYSKSRIASESIWVEPSLIGALPTNLEHSICFNYRETLVALCSEPEALEFNSSLKRESIEAFLESRDPRNRDRQYSLESWERLYELMNEIVKREDPTLWRTITTQDVSDLGVVVRVSRLAMLGFGAVLVLR